MIKLKTGSHSLTDPLDRSLANPQPQSTRLLTELIRPDSPNRPFLITSPVCGPWSPLLAGDIASAANDMGCLGVGVLDLRGLNLLTREPATELTKDTSAHSNPARSLLRDIRVLRPAPELVADGKKIRAWVADQAELCSPLVVLCGGTLDPNHWLEDPLSWSFLKPRVLVACGRGQNTAEQISQTGDRLRRANLDLEGSVMVTRSRSFNVLNYLKWVKDIAPDLRVFGRKAEA